MKRILIIDDHEVLRDGVKRIFDEPPGAAQFGEAGTFAEAIRLAREQEWDIAVLDLSLAGRSGLDVLTDLKQIQPKLPVLVFSMHSEEQYARRAFKAGASAFITKDSSRDELIRALDVVIRGGKYVSSSLAELLITGLRKGVEQQPHQQLSNREFEVLRLIGLGKTVSEIAVLLSLSDKTISTYRVRVLKKLGMKNNAELANYAIRNKLVD
jgi:two-component system invasion response regulator UvrY